MFSQQTLLLLAMLAAPRVADAHGKVVQWTMVNVNGTTTVKPGQGYGEMGVTAQRRVSKELSNNDGPRLPEIGTGTIHEDAVCNSVELSSGETWPLEPGSTLIPQWAHTDPKVTGEPVGAGGWWPSGHGGPAMEYMAACPGDNCDGFNPVDGDWFKIGESILYDGKWATEKIYQDGKWEITIPTDLKKGAYILRHELISVHGVPGQPQIYPVCIQVYLGGTGTTVPSKTYKLPAAYTEFDTSFMNYTIQAGIDDHGPSPTKHFGAPGPPLYNGAKASDAGTGSNATVAETPTTSAVAVAPTPTSLGQTGASSVVDPLAPPAAGVSAQGGISAPPDPYATAVPGAPVAGASSVANPIDPAAPVPSVPIDPAAPVPSVPADPAAPVASPPVGGPSAGDPNAPAGPPPAPGADAANPAPSIDIDLSNKGVDNGAAADGAAVDKTLPAPSGGLEDANAGTNTTDGVSASDPPATALAAGANAAASSVLSSPATVPAVTGASEYASNIQGGKCKSNTWRCQTKADGTMSLDVCGNKDSSVLEWIPSNPLCPSKCDDSKPQNPICE